MIKMKMEMMRVIHLENKHTETTILTMTMKTNRRSEMIVVMIMLTMLTMTLKKSRSKELMINIL